MDNCSVTLSDQNGYVSDPTSLPSSSNNSINPSYASTHQLDSKSPKQHDLFPISLSSSVHSYGSEPSPIRGYTKDQLGKILNSQEFKDFLYGTGCQTDQQISLAINMKVMRIYNNCGYFKAMQEYKYLNARSHMEDEEVKEEDIHYVARAIELFKEKQLVESYACRTVKNIKRSVKIPDSTFLPMREKEHDHNFSHEYAIEVICFCINSKGKLKMVRDDLCSMIEHMFFDKVVCHNGPICTASRCAVPYDGIIEGIIDFNGLIYAQIDLGKVANLLGPYLSIPYSMRQMISIDFCKHSITTLLYDLRNIALLLSAMDCISKSKKVDNKALRKWAYFTGGKQLSTDVVAGYFRTSDELLRSLTAPFRQVFKDFQDSYIPDGWDAQRFIERAGNAGWVITGFYTFATSKGSPLKVEEDINGVVKRKEEKSEQLTQNKQGVKTSPADKERCKDFLREELALLSDDTLVSIRQSMSRDQHAGRPINQRKYDAIKDLISTRLLSHDNTSPKLSKELHADEKLAKLAQKHSEKIEERVHGMSTQKFILQTNVQRADAISYEDSWNSGSDINIEQISKEEELVKGELPLDDTRWTLTKLLRSILCCKER